MARKTPAADAWWHEIEEAPRAGMPDAARLDRRARVWRWVIIVTLALSGLASLGALAAIARQGEAEPADNAPSTMSLSQPGRAEATQAVEAWLASDASPLPGATMLSWDGATQTPWTALETADGDKPGYDLWVHTFTVLGPASETAPATLYTVQVRTADSAQQGVDVLSTPSLIPAAPSVAGFADAGVWPGLTSAAAPQPVADAVSAWAKAYTSGDATALRLAVGDGDTTHAYVPLPGIAASAADVGAAAYVLTPDQVSAGVTSSPTMVVSATVTIARGTQSLDTTADLPTIQFDLLVTGADTAAPKVVAWGGPGTGTLLAAYQNATTTERGGAVQPSADQGPAPTDEQATSVTETEG